MNKYIKEIKAYTFPELTGEAKEKAKEWYLNDEMQFTSEFDRLEKEAVTALLG